MSPSIQNDLINNTAKFFIKFIKNEVTASRFVSIFASCLQYRLYGKGEPQEIFAGFSDVNAERSAEKFEQNELMNNIFECCKN